MPSIRNALVVPGDRLFQGRDRGEQHRRRAKHRLPLGRAERLEDRTLLSVIYVTDGRCSAALSAEDEKDWKELFALRVLVLVAGLVAAYWR